MRRWVADRYHCDRQGGAHGALEDHLWRQTGVDRAALDIAIELGLEYGGWCPKGGWAEDHVISPGVLELYPKLTATPLAEPEQRTEWNVRDSDATLLLSRGSGRVNSSGTKLTAVIAEKLGRNYLLLDLQKPESLHEARSWNVKAGEKFRLNIAGPREREAPGIYEEAKSFLRAVFR
jgi:hypothetical protein